MTGEDNFTKKQAGKGLLKTLADFFDQKFDWLVLIVVTLLILLALVFVK